MDQFALKIIYDIKLKKAELAKFQNISRVWIHCSLWMQQYRDHESEIYDYINIALKDSAFK